MSGTGAPVPAARAASDLISVVSTRGARLHTEIHGRDGSPTIVLVHGWTCNVSFWHPVLRRLAADHRVVLYDQRGHGRTPATPGSCSTEALADDLCAVLAATVPPGERAVVCGHSMGAMAVVAAAGRPALRERAAAALLCSTGTDRLVTDATVMPFRRGARRARAQRLLLRSRLPFGPVTPVSQRLVRRIALGPGVDPELRALTAHTVQACPRRPRAEWGRVLAGLDLSDRVARLDLPVTLVQGTADRLTPPVHARRIAGRLPHLTELIELPGVGHMTPLEAPHRVAEALRALARRHLTARQDRPDGDPLGAAPDGPAPEGPAREQEQQRS
ncbi:alpha/beta fold hydrolase [Streptomyces sp. 6N223]|uniref:alpha/beta fold hydrolase n=1 Tax=Streptomyces sp. 6N223 TaxID=3457412 RepID=UPI003FD6A162